MDFFRKYYSGVEFAGDEVKVLCPFHSDTHPSAYINTNDSLFYCHVCQWGGNEEQFVAKLNNISRKNAAKLLGHMDRYPIKWEDTYQVDLWANADFLSKVRSLGLSQETIEEMKLGLVSVLGKETLGIPVFYNKVLVDIRRYNLLKHPKLPKLMGNEGAQTGYVIPYDLWDKTLPTYVFEGEKDMLIARELGLNAITLTGGAGAVPNESTLPAFKNTELILCYDNDDAGRDGMDNLFAHLHKTCSSIKYINIADRVSEPKEDFYDYVMKYQGDVFDFLSLYTHDFDKEIVKKRFAPTTLAKALGENKLRTELTSIVTVTSEFVDNFGVPTVAKFTKGAETKRKHEKMSEGEVRMWYLEESNPDELLQLIESDAKLSQQNNNLLRFAGISKDEENVSIEKYEFQTVYLNTVIDKSTDGNGIALDVYSFGKLKVGQQYEIRYKIYNHPTKHQKLVAVCYEYRHIGSNDDYKLDRSLLSQFKTKGTIAERIDYLYQSAKHHVAKHMDFNIWLASDLVFNSILEIDYGERMSGALDIFILGDTQVGKSETTSKLTGLYEFGHFLSLKTSTTVGLIGGSTSVHGAWCNTIGAIPRQHKRLVVLEEFSGAKPDFIKTMTDIRTSKVLRLARASGELEVDCHLRMITISNPINDETGAPRFLSSFPNGVIPAMELIKSQEDVSRYDAFLMTPKKDTRSNPFTHALKGTPIDKKCYVHKAEWVTSRKPENVKFDEGIESYIWEQGEYLNSKFECNFPVFGATTAKKLAKFSVALASLILNTDETMENILVTKEIVDYMVEFIIKIYSSESFGLDRYKEEYDSHNEFTQDDVVLLEKLYPANAILFDFLAKQSKTTRSNLRTVSGLEGDKFNPIFNQLVTLKFIRISMETVYPTEKYRKVYPLINKFSINTGGTLIGAVNKGGQNVR